MQTRVVHVLHAQRLRGQIYIISMKNRLHGRARRIKNDYFPAPRIGRRSGAHNNIIICVRTILYCVFVYYYITF